MAGIGFVLKKLIKRDDLISAANAYMHSALISCGPWVFTIVSLGIAYMLCYGDTLSQGYLNFQAALFYNFAYSLIFTAPIHMVATRYIADCIYRQNITNVSASLISCLLLIVVTQVIPVAWFYFWYVKLPIAFRLAAFINFFLLSFI